MQVKYEITGRGKAARYFDVNHDTGEVSIKDDLRKEMDTEYQVYLNLAIKLYCYTAYPAVNLRLIG